MKQKEEVSAKEMLQMHLRGVRDIAHMCPQLIPAKIIYYSIEAIIPYIVIYFSSRIINELAGERRLEELARLVLLTLGIELILGLLKMALNQWRKVKEEIFARSKNKFYVKKAFDMDFSAADNQENRELRTWIRQSETWMGWGYRIIGRFVDDLSKSVVGIAGAIGLSISMFMLPVPEHVQEWSFLNQPIFILGIMILLLISVLGYPAAVNQFHRAQQAILEEIKQGNRIYSHFGSVNKSLGKEMDVRMNKHAEISAYYWEEETFFNGDNKYVKLYSGKESKCEALAGGISALFAGVIYVFAAMKAWAGAFGIGNVTQYVGAVTSLVSHVSMLLETFGLMKSNTKFLRTTYQYLDIPNDMYQGSLTTEKRSDRRYDVEFRNVSFQYPGSDLWALRHVNMKFRVGERLAIVGENGSGKTTFIKLLCRLYDPQEGQILLNGIDIRKYNYRDYMDIFSVVFQDFQLLSQPLGANVAGAAQYDRARAKKCLTDAGFGERLKSMPDGLDTYLFKEFGREGVEVSGGEAQKIAIARALYRDAPFIILDEPTAALDPIAEAEIYSKFNDIAGDKTAIYISHRLSSCKFCDEIAVFHGGQVVQQGSHEELVAEKDGKYFELWNAQAQYYIQG